MSNRRTWARAYPARSAMGRSPSRFRLIRRRPTLPRLGTPAHDEYAVRNLGYGVAGLPPEQHSGPVVPVSLPEGPLDPLVEKPPEEKPDQEVKPLSERPKLPPWPLFTRVLAFFFQMNTIVLWIVLSVIGTVVLAMGVLAVAGLTTDLVGMGAAMPWIGGMLLAASTVFTGLAWLIGGSAVSLAILQDSAAGNDKIENWPDTAWFEWVGEAFYVLVSLFVAGGIGYLAGRFVGALAGGMTTLVVASLWIFFPIALLSTLEAQTPLLPLSPVVLASFARTWRSWLLFYLETGLLGLLLLGMASGFGHMLTAFQSTASWFQWLILAACVMSSLIVAAELLYFRLLGRLAWICAEESRQAQEEQEEAEKQEREEDDDPEIHPTPVDDF